MANTDIHPDDESIRSGGRYCLASTGTSRGFSDPFSTRGEPEVTWRHDRETHLEAAGTCTLTVAWAWPSSGMMRNRLRMSDPPRV